MARVEMVMPKMGESIMEGTVIEWTKQVGDTVEQDETILEIATDKVDSEVPSPEAGVLVEILAQEGETVEVGEVIAIIETDANVAANAGSSQQKSDSSSSEKQEETSEQEPEPELESNTQLKEDTKLSQESTAADKGNDSSQANEQADSSGRFYSPLVRSIAKEEGVSQTELDSIEGSGAEGRVTKADLVNYLETRKASVQASKSEPVKSSLSKPQPNASNVASSFKNAIHAGEIHASWPTQNVEIIKMDRMRKVIAEHMVNSKKISAHVTTFAEADVTRLVKFREANKDRFYKENGFKLTYTPFFIEATIQALREFPLLNSSVNGDEIHLKREVNYGIAVALGQSGSGGLIVPVIKNAGEMNLHGLARATHDLATKARNKSLSPDDLVGGTFTLTNYGSVGNLMGTPIINQPQVAIFGTGVIQKRPMVIESDLGDQIAVRSMIYLSMSYDHRIIDGALGGAFVQRVVSLLENFDGNHSF